MNRFAKKAAKRKAKPKGTPSVTITVRENGCEGPLFAAPPVVGPFSNIPGRFDPAASFTGAVDSIDKLIADRAAGVPGVNAALQRRDPLPSDLAVGLHRDVVPAVYYRRELGMVSKSALDYVAVSASTYKAWCDGDLEDEETKALAFGRAFHMACLEPAKFADAYAVQPDFGDLRLKGPKANRKSWRAEHPGVTWIAHAEGVQLRGMAMALHRHPLASKLVANGIGESTVRWDDADTGLPCKCRPDWLCPDLELAADLKSTLDPSEAAFVRDVERYTYHRQEGLYRDGLEAIGQGVDRFLFIAIGKSPPYLVAIYTIHVDDVAVGRETNRRLIGTVAHGLETGSWPGLSTSIVEVRLRKWAR